MRQHENSSQNLKNRKLSVSCSRLYTLSLRIRSVRFSLKDLEKDFEKTEDDIKAVQSVGQIIGEVMKQLDDERCANFCLVFPRSSVLIPRPKLCAVIVKASSGPRYVVSYRPTLPVAKLKMGTRVSLDMTTLTIMRILPREVDPLVYKMSLEDPGGASFAGIGGLGEQVRELREVRFLSSTPRPPIPIGNLPRSSSFRCSTPNSSSAWASSRRRVCCYMAPRERARPCSRVQSPRP